MNTFAQWTKAKKFRQSRPVLAMAVSVIVACFSLIAPMGAQSLKAPAQSAITLAPAAGLDLQEQLVNAQGHALPPEPANFRRLGEVKTGEVAPLHTLTLSFSKTVRLTQIKSTNRDFRVEPGGSCIAGGMYVANTTCAVLVRFTPTGPGNRLGHLLVSYSTSTSSGSGLQSAAFGLGGVAYEPVISFIPALITTVPGTFPANVGLLNGAHNLAIDGGDTLWVSDTGNNVVRNMDSSGAFKTLASGFAAPWGITVDTFGEAYFDLPATNLMYEIFDYGPVVQLSGSGTASCPATAPCTLSSEALIKPGELSMDLFNDMFYSDAHQGGAYSTVQPTPADLIFLYDPFPYQTNPTSAAAMDASGDNIYSMWSNGGECEIVQQRLSNAEQNLANFTKVAGGHTCGFAGDGGNAGNAEISSLVGQIAFDAAGDMYFSDTNNQRVRRIEYNSGVIRTIAGNGTAGYSGDGGPAWSASLNTPTGVAVDSQGGVYIISSAATGQVIRKVGPQGYMSFGNQSKGTSSTSHAFSVTNTGNSTMVLTNVNITGTNAGDFKIDTTKTNCLLTTGAVLNPGQSCRIATIFTPSATGTRTAALTLLDNTLNGTDSITLTGTGTLPVPTFKITSPANGATFTSGTTVVFSASVTSSSSPQPTGKVQFKVDGANYGSAVTLSSTGTASTNVTGLTSTTHTLSATYSGDTNYAAAGPVSVSITVN